MTVNVYETPETEPVGQVRVEASTSVRGMSNNECRYCPDPEDIYFSSVQATGTVGIRYGLTEGSDVGARIGPSGLELISKIRLTNAEREFQAAVRFTASAGGEFVGTTFGRGQVALVFGWRFSDRFEGFGSIGAFDWYAVNSGARYRVNFVGVSGTIGVAIKVTDRIRFLPELGVVGFPLVATSGIDDATSPGQAFSAQGALTGFLIEGGMGVSWGP